MAPPIVGNGRVFPGRLPWPPAVFPVAVPPSPMPGLLPSAIKWNPLRAFSRFSPFPSSPVAAPPLPAFSFSLSGAGRPPAASPSSPERRPVAPSPPSASQLPPLPLSALRFTRKSPETCPRRQNSGVAATVLPPATPAAPLRCGPAAPSPPSASPRRPPPRPALGFTGTPSPTSVSPSASPEFLRQPRPPCLCAGRRRHLHLQHRSGKVALGLASPPSEPCRCSLSSSPFVLVDDSSGRSFLLAGSSSRCAASVVGFAAACSTPSSSSCSRCRLPTSPPRRPRSSSSSPSRRSRSSWRSSLRQAVLVRRPRFVKCRSPIIVFVLASALSSLVPAESRLRSRIAAEVVPSPSVSAAPVRRCLSHASSHGEIARQDTPQLLDPAIDHRHRSHLTAVQGAQLGTFRARTCGELLTVHDAAVGEVPQWSWGSALLAALYRALCESCTKTDPSATFGGCPLFLSIWAAERIAIGRPEVDQHAYEESLYEERPEVDYPTMGTLWCRRQRRWAHVQVRRSYPEFVMEFDRLLTTDVVWEPYSAAATQARAPLGLSTLCTRDQAYWMTTVPMVFDICVEPHAPFCVMRQFGFRQPFPVPFPTTVPAAVHRYSRKGQQSAGDWPAKLATFVEDWLLATEEVVDHEGEPHTEESYQAYLRWYQPRTRTRVTFAPLEQQPHVASTRDLYARHRDQDFACVVDDINRVVVDGSTTIQRLDAGIPVPVLEHLTTYTRMVESMRSILRVLTCRADDVARADAAVQRPPVPTGLRPAAHVPRPTPLPHGGFRAPFSTPPSSARPSVVPPTGFAQFAMTQATHFSQAAGSASQAAGTSSQGPPLDHAGTSLDPFLSSTVLFDITDFDFASGSTEDVIGSSQLGGAPPVQTQDQAQATPLRDTRATRAVPPDRFTYSQDHVRAQARRTKRGRGAGQGQ
ncbi:uncharacterized protein [Oryza sativa Japonica Group]|uniref:uncharacterized protein n=1 Tax=Oryza sativa subsp. japonica TaxID=39947 RepID=UPI00339C1963